MEKATRYLVIILLLLSITGCPGALDSYNRKELGHGYVFYEEGGFPLISRDIPSRRCIPQVVVDYDYDNSYIIALQNEYKLTSYEVEKYSIEQQYEVIKKKGKLKYWIIDNINDSIYGPLKKNEYLNKRNELGIPSELTLKE